MQSQLFAVKARDNHVLIKMRTWQKGPLLPLFRATPKHGSILAFREQQNNRRFDRKSFNIFVDSGHSPRSCNIHACATQLSYNVCTEIALLFFQYFVFLPYAQFRFCRFVQHPVLLCETLRKLSFLAIDRCFFMQ